MIAGIIAEYNPFHNGHLYQINKIKERFPGALLVAVMSGDFVQRGEAAVADKFLRAKMAVDSGVNLVLELPALFALRSADGFAKAGIEILNALGAVDMLFFGSECGDINALTGAAKALIDKEEEIKTLHKSLSKSGEGFAKVQGEVLLSSLGENLSSSPNDILAIEYIKAILKTKSSITPCPITRRGVMHDSSVAAGDFASASHIRELLLSGKSETAFSYMPKEAAFALFEAISGNMAPNHIKDLEKAIIASIRVADAKELKNISGCSEGLENRIKKAADVSCSFSELIENISTKRYTKSRIKRTVLNSFLNHTKESEALSPSYIRVLALNEGGAEILRLCKGKSTLPVITKLSDANFKENPALLKAIEDENRAADIYSLLFKNTKCQKSGRNRQSAYSTKTS